MIELNRWFTKKPALGSAFLLHLALVDLFHNLVDLFHNLVALVALVDLGEPT